MSVESKSKYLKMLKDTDLESLHAMIDTPNRIKHHSHALITQVDRLQFPPVIPPYLDNPWKIFKVRI